MTSNKKLTAASVVFAIRSLTPMELVYEATGCGYYPTLTDSEAETLIRAYADQETEALRKRVAELEAK